MFLNINIPKKAIKHMQMTVPGINPNQTSISSSMLCELEIAASHFVGEESAISKKALIVPFAPKPKAGLFFIAAIISRHSSYLNVVMP